MIQVKDRLYDAQLFANYLPRDNPVLRLLPPSIAFESNNFGNGTDTKFGFDAIKGRNFRYMANTILNAGFIQFDNQFNKNLNSLHSYAGLDLSYESSHLEPKVDPEINNNTLNLKYYNFTNFEVGLHYLYSKMDKVFYPNSGTFIRAGVSRSLLNDVDAEFADPEKPYPGDGLKVKGSLNDFTKFNLDFEHRIPFTDKITGIFGANAAFIFGIL